MKSRLTELLVAVEEDDYSGVRMLLRETVCGYAAASQHRGLVTSNDDLNLDPVCF